MRTTSVDRLARPDHSGTGIRERGLWSEVLPGLWQGGTDDFDTIHDKRHRADSAFISTFDFDTVITLYAWAQPVDWFVKEVRLGFWDAHTDDMPVPDILETALVAYKDWKAGKKVLVRCQAGLNRSGLITALVLMMDGYSAEDAISLIRETRHPAALCNRDFAAWLRKIDTAELEKIAA